MRKALVLTSLFLAASSGCAADDGGGGGNTTAGTGGTTAGAGTAGTAGTAAAGTSFGGTAAGGTAAGGTSTGGTTGGGGSFVVPSGGQPSGGGGAGGASGGAGGQAAGGGGAGGASGGGAGGQQAAGGSAPVCPANFAMNGSTTGNCGYATWSIEATAVCDGTPQCNFDETQRLPQYAIDGDPVSRYTSGGIQTGTEEVVVTFGGTVTVSGVKLAASAGDGPAGFAAEYSTDGNTFMAFDPPVAGKGADSLCIAFPEATAMQAVKIKQTGTTPVAWWSILEITLDGCME